MVSGCSCWERQLIMGSTVQLGSTCFLTVYSNLRDNPKKVLEDAIAMVLLSNIWGCSSISTFHQFWEMVTLQLQILGGKMDARNRLFRIRVVFLDPMLSQSSEVINHGQVISISSDISVFSHLTRNA